MKPETSEKLRRLVKIIGVISVPAVVSSLVILTVQAFANKFYDEETRRVREEHRASVCEYRYERLQYEFAQIDAGEYYCPSRVRASDGSWQGSYVPRSCGPEETKSIDVTVTCLDGGMTVWILE